MKEDEMQPPSPTTKTKLRRIKLENEEGAKSKSSTFLGTNFWSGSIVNISSPFKESVYKDNCTNSPFYKQLCQSSPLLKSSYWYHLNTPGSNFGGNDQGPENNAYNSPILEMKDKLDFTPFKSPINQA